MNNVFLIESSGPILYDYMRDFTRFVCDKLNIENIPVLIVPKTGGASFGNYSPGSRTIQVAIEGRHIADILRTLAHELVHESQNSKDLLSSPLEDLEYQANAVAGMLMREYNKLHPELYDAEPEEAELPVPEPAAVQSPPPTGVAVAPEPEPTPLMPYHPLDEEAVVNSVGDGKIAGLGIGTQGEPGLKKKPSVMKRKTLTQFKSTLKN